MIAPMNQDARLRVALVADHYAPHLGGIESHVQALAQHLGERGHHVQVITTYPGPELLDSVNVRRVRVPLVPVWNIAYTPAGIRKLETLFVTERFDVVHSHHSVFSPAAACAAFVSQRLGLRTVCTFHSVLRGYTPALSLIDRWSGWSRWPVTYSAVSSSVAADVRRLVPGRTVPILANGVDAAYWRVTPSPRSADRIRIVSTMRLAPRKRPRALIDMIAALRQALPAGIAIDVSIIGDGPERSAIEKRVSALGLSDIITMTGRLSRVQVRDAYANADLFVLPTIEESFGLAALEARCAGLPVVALRASGTAGFIRHGTEGLLAEDDSGLIHAMARLATDDDVLQSIAAHNRNTPAPFQWADVLADHERVYRMNVGAA